MTERGIQRRSPPTGTTAILVIGFLVLFIGGGARFAIGLTFKPIVEYFGWSRSELGLTVATFQTVSAITMFVAGYLTDRIGPRSILIAGMLLSAIGIGLMGNIAEPWHALVLYGVIFAIGNGAASLIPVGVMIVGAFPRRTALANSVAISGMSLGQLVVIAILTVALLVLSWQSIFLLLGIAHLVIVPILFLTIPASHVSNSKDRNPVPGLSIRRIVYAQQFWALLIIYAICGFNDFFVATHVVAYAQDRGIGLLLSGNLLAVMGLTALLGVLATGAASDRFGLLWPTAISFVARIFIFALLMFDQSFISIALFSLVFGATFLMTAPLTVLFVDQYFGRRYLGALTGLITMVHHIGGGAGAYLGSVAFDVTGSYELAFPVMLISSAVALLLVALLRHKPVAAIG